MLWDDVDAPRPAAPATAEAAQLPQVAPPARRSRPGAFGGIEFPPLVEEDESTDAAAHEGRSATRMDKPGGGGGGGGGGSDRVRGGTARGSTAVFSPPAQTTSSVGGVQPRLPVVALGLGASNMGVSGQFTATTIGPIFGPRRRMHQPHALFDESGNDARRSSRAGGSGRELLDSRQSTGTSSSQSYPRVAGKRRKERGEPRRSLVHIFDREEAKLLMWTMSFADPIMEEEYLRFFCHPKRVIVLGYCIIASVVAIITQLLYVGVPITIPSRIMFAVVTMIWMVAGILSFRLRREAGELQRRAEEEELGTCDVDEHVDGDTLSDNEEKSSSARTRRRPSRGSARSTGNSATHHEASGSGAASDGGVWSNNNENNAEETLMISASATNPLLVRREQGNQPAAEHEVDEPPVALTRATRSTAAQSSGSSDAVHKCMPTLTSSWRRRNKDRPIHDSRGTLIFVAADASAAQPVTIEAQLCKDDAQCTMRRCVQSKMDMAFETVSHRLTRNYEAYAELQRHESGAHSAARENNHAGLEEGGGGTILSRRVIEEEFVSLWHSAVRFRLRRNAVRTERVFMLIILGNFVMGIAVYLGKGHCDGGQWTMEEARRSCAAAIQSDGLMLLLIVCGAFFNPVRLKFFLPIYVILLAVFHAVKWAPGMLDVVAAYFWCSVVVFTVEAAVCVALVGFSERNARAECKLYVRRQVRNREASQVRRQSERTVGAQIPVEVLRIAAMTIDQQHASPQGEVVRMLDVDGGSATMAVRDVQLWGWSSRLTYCCITVDGFRSWTLQRGPSEVVELTQALLNLFDRIRMRCIAGGGDLGGGVPIPKAHRFGDCYSVFLIPHSSHHVHDNKTMSHDDTMTSPHAQVDVREAVDVAAGFALLCIAEGTDMIQRKMDSRVIWGASSGALMVRAALAVGPSGGSLLPETRNIVVVGSVVQETRAMVGACGGVTQWTDTPPSLRRHESSTRECAPPGAATTTTTHGPSDAPVVELFVPHNSSEVSAHATSAIISDHPQQFVLPTFDMCRPDCSHRPPGGAPGVPPHSSAHHAKRLLVAADNATGMEQVYQFSTRLTGQLSMNYLAAEALGLLRFHHKHVEAVHAAALVDEDAASYSRPRTTATETPVPALEAVCDATCTYVAGFDRRSMGAFLNPRTVVAATFDRQPSERHQIPTSAADTNAAVSLDGNVVFIPVTIHAPASLQPPRQASPPPWHSGQPNKGFDSNTALAAVDAFVSEASHPPDDRFTLPGLLGSNQRSAQQENVVMLPVSAGSNDEVEREMCSQGTFAVTQGRSECSIPLAGSIVPPMLCPAKPATGVVHNTKVQSAVQATAAERVALAVDYGFRVRFVNPQTEAAYASHTSVTTWSMLWSSAARLASIVALAAVCMIDGQRTVSPREPLFWVIVGVLATIVAVIVIFLTSPTGEVRIVHVALSVGIQGAYIAAIGVAGSSDTIIGNSQMVWLFVMTNWSFHRPALTSWYWMWAQDAVVGVLALVRAIELFGIAGSVLTLSSFFAGAHVVYSFVFQSLMEHSRRESFALEQHVEYLKEEQERDFQGLLNTLTNMVPRGVAGNLVKRAKQRLEFGGAPKLHPAWSTSFCTATEETPFVIIQLRDDGSGKRPGGGPSQSSLSMHDGSGVSTSAAADVLAGARPLLAGASMRRLDGQQTTNAEQRALATLQLVQFVLSYAASPACPFSEQLQVVKADDDTVLFTAARWSDDRDDYDEIRSHDVLSFSVSIAKAIDLFMESKYRLRPRQRSSSSSTVAAVGGGGGGHTPSYRMVAATGPLMGSVVGVTSLSFEYYGAWIGKASALLDELEWGCMIGTERVYNFHRLFVDAAATGRVAPIGRYATHRASFAKRAEMTSRTRSGAAHDEHSHARERKRTAALLPGPSVVPPRLPTACFRVLSAGATPVRVVFLSKTAEEFEP